MSQRQTTVAERNRMVDLKLEGYTLPEIAEQTGWSFECVRKWWRRVNSVGQISLADHRYGVGATYADQDVRITFDAQQAHFIVTDEQQQVITTLEPKSLPIAYITGLELDDQ